MTNKEKAERLAAGLGIHVWNLSPHVLVEVGEQRKCPVFWRPFGEKVSFGDAAIMTSLILDAVVGMGHEVNMTDSTVEVWGQPEKERCVFYRIINPTGTDPDFVATAKTPLRALAEAALEMLETL